MITGCAEKHPVIFRSSEIKSIDKDIDLSEIEPVQVQASTKEIKEEAKYRLIQFADIVDLKDEPIVDGDIVTINISLYDKNDNCISEYSNIEANCIVGDLEYDPYIENILLGKMSGDKIEYVDAQQTVYKYENVAYCSLTIDSVERYVYPELTKDFLMKNFAVDDEEAFYALMKNETEAIMYQMKLEDVQNQLINKIGECCEIGSGFEMKVKDRYNKLISKYVQYGNLYGMSLEEVLLSYHLSIKAVKQNARKYQLEWELVMYFVGNGEILITESELEKAKRDYAAENGYETVQELIEDSGEQYLLEEILVKKMKDYVYKKYIE